LAIEETTEQHLRAKLKPPKSLNQSEEMSKNNYELNWNTCPHQPRRDLVLNFRKWF